MEQKAAASNDEIKVEEVDGRFTTDVFLVLLLDYINSKRWRSEITSEFTVRKKIENFNAIVYWFWLHFNKDFIIDKDSSRFLHVLIQSCIYAFLFLRNIYPSSVIIVLCTGLCWAKSVVIHYPRVLDGTETWYTRMQKSVL